MLEPLTLFHMIMAFVVICGFGGLRLGLSNRRQDIENDTKFSFAVVGLVITGIICLVLAFVNLTPSSYEVVGFMLCLSVLICCLGVGLCIGPARRPDC